MRKHANELLNQYDYLMDNSSTISLAIRNFVKLEKMFLSYKKNLYQKDILFYEEELPSFLEQIVLNLDEVFTSTKQYYSLEFYQKLLSDFSVLSRHYRIDEEKEKFPSYIDQGLKNQLLDFNYQLLSYIYTFNPRLFPDSDSKTLIAIDYERFYNTLVKD